VDSQNRIRTSLRLELDTTNKELASIEQQIKKGSTDPEVITRKEELTAYKEKLEKQYEEITGLTSAKASKLEIDEPVKKKSAAMKIIFSLIGTVGMATGFYNMALHGVVGFMPTDLIENITSNMSSEISIINSMLFESSAMILVACFGLALFGFLLALLFSPRSKSLFLRSVLDISLAVWVSYSIFLIYLEFNDNVYDVLWAFKEAFYIFGGIMIATGLFGLIASLSQKKILYKLLGLIEGLLITGTGSYYIFMMLEQMDVRAVWPVTFSALTVAYTISILKGLFLRN
jgi:hypothetical protein